MVRRHGPLSEYAEKVRERDQRLRLAFIAGADDRFRSTLGRGLTDEELQRVLARYPGDLPQG